MRKQLSIIITVLLICVGMRANAQIAQNFDYQAVLRDNAGAILANQAVDLRFTIRDSSATGHVWYRETLADTTTAYGLIRHAVGTGNADQGIFAQINWWPYATKFLQVEVSIAGGPYNNLGVQPLAAAPKAFFADYASWALLASTADTADFAINTDTTGDNVSFRVQDTSVQGFTSSLPHSIINFRQVIYNDGGGWNGGNLSFVAPSDGLYHFEAGISTTQASAVIDVFLSIYDHTGQDYMATTGTTLSPIIPVGYLSVSATLKLNAGDVVSPVIDILYVSPQSFYTVNRNTMLNYFSGHKIR